MAVRPTSTYADRIMQQAVKSNVHPSLSDLLIGEEYASTTQESNMKWRSSAAGRKREKKKKKRRANKETKIFLQVNTHPSPLIRRTLCNRAEPCDFPLHRTIPLDRLHRHPCTPCMHDWARSPPFANRRNLSLKYHIRACFFRVSEDFPGSLESC
ncbi:uncharacterized protein EI90DRAFT_3060526 [Cantharellus anzutake]|uniref:uncharacterized protein n=1 Tax=Cantharellus anzutake TaxID=1750568 RepID=UPI0019048C1B|nr:uncharacterized protein EI90DRAFT_3060526 [Cantharellus anzutake]KAF8330379.1 hypothetical protein EI90DRAFT_3060526 [Cantharellus anzutake]